MDGEVMMRSLDEVQRAHDMLIGIVLDQALLAKAVNPKDLPFIVAALDVLCWLLHHDHNVSFAKNIAVIEARLREQGIILAELPEEQKNAFH